MDNIDVSERQFPYTGFTGYNNHLQSNNQTFKVWAICVSYRMSACTYLSQCCEQMSMDFLTAVAYSVCDLYPNVPNPYTHPHPQCVCVCVCVSYWGDRTRPSSPEHRYTLQTWRHTPRCCDSCSVPDSSARTFLVDTLSRGEGKGGRISRWWWWWGGGGVYYQWFVTKTGCHT